jgi:DNA-binding NarL/FixJ family response regulator
MRRTGVLVVDDHHAVRNSICQLLSSVPELEVVCEASSGEEALEKVKEHLPDVILLDISLPGISGLEAAGRIRDISPVSLILFVSQHDSPQVVKRALSVGGHGYLLKSTAGLELIEAIRAVQRGKLFVSKSLVLQGFTTYAM